MKKIVLYECEEDLARQIGELIKNQHIVRCEKSSELSSTSDLKLVIMQGNHNRLAVVRKIKNLRETCSIPGVPIILLKAKGDYSWERQYLKAGATEVISFHEEPQTGCRILKDYLTPETHQQKDDLKYLLPFIHSTKHILRVMAGLEVESAELFFRRRLWIHGDISGIISLSGAAVGITVLTLTWSLAREIIARMSGMPLEDINTELVHDGVGELTSMIAGTAKSDLDGPSNLQLSLPSVVLGAGHEFNAPQPTNIGALIFRTLRQTFTLHVCLTSNSPQETENGE